MKLYIFILPLILFTFFSCSNSDKGSKLITDSNGKIQLQKFDEHGRLTSEQAGTKEGGKFIANGTFKEYYPNGEVRKLAFKSNNVDTGNNYVFYENGKIDSMNIKKGKTTYYSVVFDKNGNPRNSEMVFEILQRDTGVLGKPLLIASKIIVYGRMTSKVNEKLYFNESPIWDSAYEEKSHFPLAVIGIFHDNFIVKRKGTYRFKCSITYVDNGTGENIYSETKNAVAHVY